MIDYKDHVYVQPILHFLEKIGIPYQFTPIDIDTYVPGINIHNGTLQIDLEKLSFPGDLLYEAGRIALAPSAVRPTLTHPIDNQLDFDIATNSMMTIAWSYAAAIDSGTQRDHRARCHCPQHSWRWYGRACLILERDLGARGVRSGPTPQGASAKK